MSDAIVEAVYRDMRRRVGEQQARRWATQLGIKQSVNEYERRQQIALAVRLLDEGTLWAEIRQRLMLTGMSKATANRRINDALAQRGPRGEPVAGHANRIATTPAKP